MNKIYAKSVTKNAKNKVSKFTENSSYLHVPTL